MYLLDTDVLIDELRHYAPAKQFLLSTEEDMAISVITVAELYAGIRNQKEDAQLKELLATFIIYDVTEAIARQAGKWKYRYFKSHGTGMADAVLAATCEVEGLELVTLNRKHYPMLASIHTPYRK